MLGKHQYAPATRASDISRLLDPSYTSASGSPHQTVVYVDHFGDFHDPDYRDFPIVHVPKESRWESNYSTHPALFDDDGDEQEERDEFDSRHSRLSAYRTQTGRRSTSRPRSPGLSSTPLSPAYSPYSHYYSSSPSQSYEEESEFSQSPPETPFELESEKKRSRLSFCGSRKTGLQSPPPIATTTRLARVSSPMSRIVPIHDEHEEVSNLHKEDDEAVEEQDWTPTCSMAIRRQWEAVRLRLGLGVFRAKRRIKRKDRLAPVHAFLSGHILVGKVPIDLCRSITLVGGPVSPTFMAFSAPSAL
ncbi:hypothetical protein BDM02DRAFT_3272189 [Thelephora ganbajun]|uniref:Uncharacterized protein n=1 Tax=Thelephora ganbajun TaxID=370292 RepID=A0ACB6Z5U8_THEGA|nr:hypothetical protein BDM02DRAFT_3272189 [Thelephora ganbajun]